MDIPEGDIFTPIEYYLEAIDTKNSITLDTEFTDLEVVGIFGTLFDLASRADEVDFHELPHAESKALRTIEIGHPAIVQDLPEQFSNDPELTSSIWLLASRHAIYLASLR
jgi:hypothetical protein